MRYSLSLCVILLLFGCCYGNDNSRLKYREIHPDNFDVAYVRRPTPEFVEREMSVTGRDPYFSEAVDGAGLDSDAEDRPMNVGGLPGVAILDVNGDGHQDIYVTNGPGAPNYLGINDGNRGNPIFSQQAVSRGADLTGKDCTAVCFADVDNDGDLDMYVGGQNVSDTLLLNDGTGNFVDVSSEWNVASVTNGLSPAACAFGDVNGDGHVDLYVANTFDWIDQKPIFKADAVRQHNILFVNVAGSGFSDGSLASGLLDVSNPGSTWAIGLVDYDNDGDLDVWEHNDQASIIPVNPNVVGRLRVFDNDGTGHFDEVTDSVGFGCSSDDGEFCFYASAWMGTAFPDLNCDGLMDHFASTLGTHTQTFAIFGPGGFPGPSNSNPGLQGTSRWFTQTPDGKFVDSIKFTFQPMGPPLMDFDLGGTPFGWGTECFDLDNDGDLDCVMHGGLLGLSDWADVSNPGAIFENLGTCEGTFGRYSSVESDTNHGLRSVRGVAVGDLNGDGFPDVVSASTVNVDPSTTLLTYAPLGSPWDADAKYIRMFLPHPTIPANESANFFPLLKNADVPPFLMGDLSVELSNARSSNKYVIVTPIGTKGITDLGTVNRAGIGANFFVLPHVRNSNDDDDGGVDDERYNVDYSSKGPVVLKPVLGGSSHASQHSLVQNFGLGQFAACDVFVHWPGPNGGAWNVRFDVRQGDKFVFPEIPCSFKDTNSTYQQFGSCVRSSILQMRNVGLIDGMMGRKLTRSMLTAFEIYSDNENWWW